MLWHVQWSCGDAEAPGNRAYSAGHQRHPAQCHLLFAKDVFKVAFEALVVWPWVDSILLIHLY